MTAFRIGFGYDTHQLAPGRKLVLGGVTIPHSVGLLGHSDADVLLHAIMDALLGALALGDIGLHFPNTDPAYKDADSVKLLQHVYALIQSKGYHLGNLDAVILAEEPKLKPHFLAMQTTIAQAMNIKPDQISIKATTTETMGPEGRKEGMSCHAVALLIQNA